MNNAAAPDSNLPQGQSQTSLPQGQTEPQAEAQAEPQAPTNTQTQALAPGDDQAQREEAAPVAIRLEDVALGYGPTIVQQGLSFAIRRSDVFIIMGGSGCGKSTVMRALTGLLAPRQGQVFLQGESLWEISDEAQAQLLRGVGVMYQSGALWSSMTLEENIALPLEQYTPLSKQQINELAEYKLALVGLAGFGGYYPGQISGGMRKRVGVARAMALDPDILFFDEPSAGLDPLSARRLDDLILELRDSLGTTMVVITHDLDSLFLIGDDAVFLDAETRTMLTTGNPKQLRDHSEIDEVRAFLRRGES